ncbi:MAG: (2Fe-2S)-binding protein [Phenylobacterium sp.]|nr:MAG: (2Fe-2S)-binding protein [Phenylobacterium sp.]
MTDQNLPRGPSRRGVLAGSAAGSAAAGSVALGLIANPSQAAPRSPGGAHPMELTLNINGRDHRLSLDPRTTLLDALRDHLGLTGSKKGCDQGQCGACTVHVDGRRILACLTLAAAVQGRPVATVEGLAHGDKLHPMQAAFVEHDAFQCGYCTPGQLMSAVACVHEGHAHDRAAIREHMSGNLCRCGAYPKIVDAIEDAAPKMERG